MTRFLFLPVLGAGHVHPMGAVAAELVARGESAAVVSGPEWAGGLAAQGVEVIDAPPGLVAPVAQTPATVARSLLMLLHAPAAVRRIVSDAVPGTVVVHDAMTAWRRVLPSPSVAFATGALTNGPSAVHALAGLAGGSPGRTERLVALARRIGLTALLDRLPLPFSSHADLVVASVPRAFQPAGDSFGDRVRFVGPCVGARPGEADDPVVPSPTDPRPLVVISLGTALNDRPGFFADCLGAVADRPWRVVMGVGERIDPADLGPVPGHVVVRRHIPQLALLARAAAFVSHAGMNSVLESLRAGVPMALWPQQPEQRGNAAAVVARGAGLVLPRRPTSGDIAAAIEHLLDDPGPRRAARTVAASLADAGGAGEAADALQAFAAARGR